MDYLSINYIIFYLDIFITFDIFQLNIRYSINKLRYL